jgi:hypothetical protein
MHIAGAVKERIKSGARARQTGTSQWLLASETSSLYRLSTDFYLLKTYFFHPLRIILRLFQSTTGLFQIIPDNPNSMKNKKNGCDRHPVQREQQKKLKLWNFLSIPIEALPRGGNRQIA